VTEAEEVGHVSDLLSRAQQQQQQQQDSC